MSRSKTYWTDELKIIELIEQSIFLVRSTFPAYGWIYYLSSIPFIICFIRFWSIMSSKLIMPFEITRFALLLTLFFWIKSTGQSIYCKHLLSKLMDEKPSYSLSQFSNTAVNSIFIHPIGIIILIVSCIFVFPLGYAIIFSQYLFIASSEQEIHVFKILKKSYQLATQKGKYQHLVLFFLIGLSLIIFFNMMLVFFFLPHLAKIFFNMDTIFTQSTFPILNTIFILIIFWASYLIFDPIFKGFYVNLYFHINSLSNGEDIMAECRRLSQKRGLKKVSITALMIITLIFACSPKLLALNNLKKSDEEQQLTMNEDKYQIEEMSRVISEVSKDDIYRWRYQYGKGKEKKESKGFLSQMMEDLLKTIGNWLKPVGKFLKKMMDRIGEFLKKWFSPEEKTDRKSTESFWIDLWPKLFTIITIFIFLIGVTYLFWQHHKDKITIVQSNKKKIPDISAEKVDATELEEDEWLKLGQELRAKGELTLALRTAFLAILSFLHKNNYLVFERYKTNYNYLTEIKSNFRNNNIEMVNKFQACIEIFERSWYGKYPVDMDTLVKFEGYQKNIMGI